MERGFTQNRQYVWMDFTGWVSFFTSSLTMNLISFSYSSHSSFTCWYTITTTIKLQSQNKSLFNISLALFVFCLLYHFIHCFRLLLYVSIHSSFTHTGIQQQLSFSHHTITKPSHIGMIINKIFVDDARICMVKSDHGQMQKGIMKLGWGNL